MLVCYWYYFIDSPTELKSFCITAQYLDDSPCGALWLLSDIVQYLIPAQSILTGETLKPCGLGVVSINMCSVLLRSALCQQHERSTCLWSCDTGHYRNRTNWHNPSVVLTSYAHVIYISLVCINRAIRADCLWTCWKGCEATPHWTHSVSRLMTSLDEKGDGEEIHCCLSSEEESSTWMLSTPNPVQSSSPLGKVFEAITTKRLMSWTENTDQLPTEQSGFRKHHSTNDKLFELTQAVCQAQRRVGAIFLDIEKAFDRVWHNGLHYELLHMNAPALLPRWISSFLRNRTVKVRILGHTSREIAINYGVPQGSPISPLLFLLYMSKLPNLLPNNRRSLFADDFMIYSESSITRSHLIQFNLYGCSDLIWLRSSHHAKLHQICQVLFERRKSNRLNPQDVTYNGQVIHSSSSVKFLSITFDSVLTFRSHFRTVASLARHRLLKLNSIFSTTYGPSTPTLAPPPLQILHQFIVWLRCASYMRSLSRHTT